MQENGQSSRESSYGRQQLLSALSWSCDAIVRHVNMNGIYFQIVILLVVLIKAQGLSYIIPILFLWFFDMQELYVLIRFLSELSKQNAPSSLEQEKLVYSEKVLFLMKLNTKLQIIDCLIGYGFKACIILYFEDKIPTLAIPALAVSIYFGLRILIQVLCRRQQEDQESSSNDPLGLTLANQILRAKQHSTSFFYVSNHWAFRIYLVAQTLFYSLKIERYIDWTWSEVFWVFWVFFCIIVGITLILFLLVIVKTCEYCNGSDKDLIEIQGLFWFFCLMAFASATSCYTVIQYCLVLGKLDETDDIHNKTDLQNQQNHQQLQDYENDLMQVTYLIAVGVTFTVLYFILFSKKICIFVKMIMFEYEEEEEARNLPQFPLRNQSAAPVQANAQGSANPGSQVPPKKVRMAYKSKMVLEEKELMPTTNLPQFASRVSSTYFKFLMNKTDAQQEVESKKKDHKKKQVSSQEQQASKITTSKQSSRIALKNLNRSATATITITTQGNVNTQTDMLQTSRLNTLEKQFAETTEEDISKEGEKKDVRAEMYNKKNMKALNKQWHHDGNAIISEIVSPNASNMKKFTLPTEPLSESNYDTQFQPDHQIALASPLLSDSQPFQNRRLASLVMPNQAIIKPASTKDGRHLLNQTAPFIIQNEDQNNKIREEDNEDDESRYYQRKQREQYKQKINENGLDLIKFDNDTEFSHMSNSNNVSQSQAASVVNCLVCFDKPPDSIFNPCGHGGLCYECAIDLMKKTGECLLCRFKIEEILKIDVESRSQGIMKILSSTKFIKVREKIEITEQEYQYYSALKRARQGEQIQQQQHLQQSRIRQIPVHSPSSLGQHQQVVNQQPHLERANPIPNNVNQMQEINEQQQQQHAQAELAGPQHHQELQGQQEQIEQRLERDHEGDHNHDNVEDQHDNNQRLNSNPELGQVQELLRDPNGECLSS